MPLRWCVPSQLLRIVIPLANFEPLAFGVVFHMCCVGFIPVEMTKLGLQSGPYLFPPTVTVIIETP